MKLAHMKKLAPGLALLVGIMAGSALSMVPGSTAEAPDAQVDQARMICSRSCKPCSTQFDCGDREGSCGVWRCMQ